MQIVKNHLFPGSYTYLSRYVLQCPTGDENKKKKNQNKQHKHCEAVDMHICIQI